MSASLHAPGFPEQEIRRRARTGTSAAFAAVEEYGGSLHGQQPEHGDSLDALRITPPVFVPHRLERLIELGREPMFCDVELNTTIGGFSTPLPVYLSALGSTQASADLGVALSRQAGRVGVPMVIGENVVPMTGYGRISEGDSRSLLSRIRAYTDCVADGTGGVVVQQSTEDADAEVWNLAYSDPSVSSLLTSDRLAFELKVGQGAKPGLGGMTVLDSGAARAVAEQFAVQELSGTEGMALRSGSPGTFTDEILRQQIRLMRNNFPRARVWVKLHPARDVAQAARVAWEAGADSVTIDGAEGGTGWAPTALLQHVGLPLLECLRRTGRPAGSLLVSGRMWEGARAVKALALGARGVGLGRAALLAADEDSEHGLERLVECLAFELRLLVSALGKYELSALGPEDLWDPTVRTPVDAREPSVR